MDILRAFLEQQPLLTLFLVVGLGYALGGVNIRGFALGSGGRTELISCEPWGDSADRPCVTSPAVRWSTPISSTPPPSPAARA